MRNENREERRAEILENCFDCFCENGIADTSTKKLSKACGFSAGNIFNYFENKDQIIIECTAHCMAKVEQDFMDLAPQSFDDIEKYVNEIPYWTAEKHGAKYRFMYQVYTSPRFREYGKEFFDGVNLCYAEYAKQLSPKVGIPADTLTAMIFVFVRAAVHFALFGDEEYLKAEIGLLKKTVELFKKDAAKK